MDKKSNVQSGCNLSVQELQGLISKGIDDTLERRNTERKERNFFTGIIGVLFLVFGFLSAVGTLKLLSIESINVIIVLFSFFVIFTGIRMLVSLLYKGD